MKYALLSLLFVANAFAGGIECHYPLCGPTNGPCKPCLKDNGEPIQFTPAGIPIDTAAKQAIYEFAKVNVKHPSWGLAHSERDYLVTMRIAREEYINVDTEVLFAAAFLHDIGGLPAYAKPGVDHAERSVEVIHPLMLRLGFDMDKWGALKEVILGHTYYGKAPESRFAQAFRDADVLDFLGAIGVARLLAANQDPGFYDGTLAPSIKTVREFSRTMAEKCLTTACLEIAQPRVVEMIEFLDKLDRETLQSEGR